MKTIKTITAYVITGLLTTGLFLSFTACSQQSPLEPEGSDNQSATLFKRPIKATSSTALMDYTANSSSSTTEQGSLKARYSSKWDAYNGGKIILSQGSQFELLYGSLTPPADLHGNDVTINMSCIQSSSNNELRFEFGPHGATFDPPAIVWFHYTGNNPQLYYIEDDGSYTEQQPDEVDTKNQWLTLKINHFSRYAVSWAE